MPNTETSRLLNDPTLFTDMMEAAVDDVIAVRREYRRVLEEWPEAPKVCRASICEIEAGIRTLKSHVHQLCWILAARARLNDQLYGTKDGYSAVLRQSIENARHAVDHV